MFSSALATCVVGLENLREPAIGRSDCNIEDQVKRLVEWCVGTAGLTPSVFVNCLVDCDTGEVTVFPHVLVLGKVKEHDLLEDKDISN